MNALLITDRRSPLAKRRVWLVLILFIVMFAVAIPLDTPLSKAAHDSGLAKFLKEHQGLTAIWRFPGTFYFALLFAQDFLVYHWRDRGVLQRRIWRQPAILIISSILSGLNQTGKWIFGRYRPFKDYPLYAPHWFRGGWWGMFNTKNLGFPSGDSSCAFAAAFSLAILLPRWRWLWFTLAILVAIERVCENSHYPTDVVAGAALGWACALAAWTVTDRIIFKRALADVP